MTFRTKWNRLKKKNHKKQHIMPQSKKATDICLSEKGYKASSKPQWESISKK